MLKNKFVQYLLGIVMIIACVVALMFFALRLTSYFDVTLPMGQYFLELAYLLIVFYLAMFIQLICHEGGHLIFGLLSGYSFVSFRIFSFTWIKINNQIKFKQMSLAGTAGQCLMNPPDWSEKGIPVVLYNLGGVIVNVVLGLLGFVMTYLLPPGLLNAFFDSLGIAGLFMAFTNGIPLKLNAVNNDGYNVFDITSSINANYGFFSQLRVNALQASGIRLKDMPDNLFELPNQEDALKNSIASTVLVFDENRCMDQHDFKKALERIEMLKDPTADVVGIYKVFLKLDEMYIEMLNDNRKEIIEQCLDRNVLNILRQIKNFPSIIRSEIAIAKFYKKDEQKEKLLYESFEKVAKNFPNEGEIESERELIKLLEEKEKQISSTNLENVIN